MSRKVLLLYDDLYAALYEGILQRSHGSKLNASVGAVLALTATMMAYWFLLFTLVTILWRPLDLMAQRWFWYGSFAIFAAANAGWFLNRNRYRRAVLRFRQKSDRYRRHTALAATTYYFFPFGLLLAISLVMARLHGQL